MLKSVFYIINLLGTDEDRIIRELMAYTTIQRQLIKSKYFALYGKKLEEDLASELSGPFLQAIIGLLTPTDEYEAHILKKAIEVKT